MIEGRAHLFGDNINTDYIIAGKYTKTLDYSVWVSHLFEDISPGFSQKVKPGDCVVDGRNFGCGSSREQAAVALKYAQVGAVLAKSFARIFFRNAINLGIPALICNTDEIHDGDQLEIDLTNQKIYNLTTHQILTIEPLPDVMIQILSEGGLTPYLKKFKTFKKPQVKEGRA